MALRIAALSSTIRIFAELLTAEVCDREVGKEILRFTHFNYVELLNYAQVILHRQARDGSKGGEFAGRANLQGSKGVVGCQGDYVEHTLPANPTNGAGGSFIPDLQKQLMDDA
jgi:hypothetical protein